MATPRSPLSPISPSAPPLSPQTSQNLNVLPTNIVFNQLFEEIKQHFSEEIAVEFDRYIKENDFDLDSIRDDIENLEDSLLISEIAEQFEWENDTKEQSRFRLTIQNVLNPQLSQLTKMKSAICRNNIPSELLVCGFLRNLEDEFLDTEEEEDEDEEDENASSLSKPMHDNSQFVYSSSTMSIVPDDVMRLCVRYYQAITVYGVGRNDRGEFGVPTRGNFMKLAELEWITASRDFVLSSIIPCTINGIAYISSDRDLWLCGFNKYGQFGLGHCEHVVDIAVQHPFYKENNLKIEDVSHGKRAYHMFVTCSNGQIYCHGANEWGQCGINRQQAKELEPVLLDVGSFLDQYPVVTIDDISCGIEHSLFLSSLGHVYSCGHNKWGQLGCKNSGFGGVQHLMQPRLITAIHGAHLIATEQEHEDKDTDKEDKEKEKDESNHKEQESTLCLDEDSTAMEKSVSIKSIHCGDSNSYCIDVDGNLWSFGRNEFGELGTDETQLRLRWQPKMIEFFRENEIKIYKICCGSDHVLVLDECGKVYSWGFGKYGCCGDGDTKHRYKPQQMTALDRYNIVDVSCGSTHSIAVSDERDIWSWGYNAMNQCCIDTFDENKWFSTCKEIKTPRMVNTAITKIMTDMNNVIGVRTATNSTLFICEPKLIP